MKWLYRMMIRLLGRRRPPDCRHDWKIKQRISVWDEEESDERPVAFKYRMRCAKCGDMKFVGTSG